MCTYKTDLDFLLAINDEIQSWVCNAEQKDRDDTSYYKTDCHWKAVYGLVFNKEVSGKIHEALNCLNNELDYYSPDTTYREDLLAFSNALNDKVKLLRGMTARQE